MEKTRTHPVLIVTVETSIEEEELPHSAAVILSCDVVVEGLEELVCIVVDDTTLLVSAVFGRSRGEEWDRGEINRHQLWLCTLDRWPRGGTRGCIHRVRSSRRMLSYRETTRTGVSDGLNACCNQLSIHL